MDSVDSYLSDILAAIVPLAARELALADAYGAVLDADVTARWPLPAFDNSAMDGYAVLASDVAAASPRAPVTLPVDGEIAAGDTGSRELTPGSCIRIMTGAAMPAVADAVVPVELTDGGTQRVVIRGQVAAGASVRRRGGDAAPGDLLLAAGTRIGPVQLGLLAAAGLGSVLARPRPRVTVISTGDELIEPGQPLVPGQIWESNSVMLAAAARQAGCEARRYPVVRDDADAVLAAVADALTGADLLVTSGGVSMGAEHDVVKAALSKLGTVAFRQVAMQPGMPQGFGVVGAGTPIFTLPGNPVSAYVSFSLFVAPALDALQNSHSQRSVPVRAVLTAPARSPQGKRSFLRGILDRQSGAVAQVTPVLGQASHQLASLARANALIVVPEPVTALAAGDPVDVLELP
ncbi:MAG TPA: gephyrin-like molybdotransferase Glp [Streptosporangiaceae bacterium]|nr:gephyrin-like molybdotransferase Glp [Streptosporangiaceae bacterium]